MKIFSETNIGNKRSTNQDAFAFKKINDNCGWSIVCDGMGGANGGDVASSLACETIGNYLSKNFKQKLSDKRLTEICLNFVEIANDVVHEKSHEDENLNGMGTTLVAVLVDKNKIAVTSVGDSRVYLKRENNISQITIDHSFVQKLVNDNQITPQEAKVHPLRNIITRSIGVRETVQSDCNIINTEKGDIILLCSDGLSGYCSDEVLNEFLNKYDAENITNKLIKYALEQGGSDNITVSVIYL